MATTNPAYSGVRPPAVLLWPIILGGAGFAAGFFGPIVLNPDANQGPLVGIFLSGPGGVVLGLVLGVICRAAKIGGGIQWKILGSSAALLVLVTLGFCTPGPQLRGYVVEARIEGCSSPAERADTAISYWEKRIAQVTWAAARAGWQADARSKLSDGSAVILDATVLRKNAIYESRKPWNRGRLSATGWRDDGKRQSYYASFSGGSCSTYSAGSTSKLFIEYDAAGFAPSAEDWPPRELPAFLVLLSLEPVPSHYQDFAGN